jgi:DNA-binding XRE family transcriptional regulator
VVEQPVRVARWNRLVSETKPVYPFFRRNSYGLYEVWPDPRAIAFGKTLRRARQLAGLSQRQLAAIAGISQSVISRLERGKAPGTTVERLIILSDAIGRRMPLGFCPHDHECRWGPIRPEPYPRSDANSIEGPG